MSEPSYYFIALKL